MKKLLVTIGLAAVAAGAFAQGTVNPANSTTTKINTNAPANNIGTTPGVGNTSGAAQGFYYEVLTAPSTVTTVDSSLQGLLSGPWSDTSMQLTNTAVVGRLTGLSGAAGVVQNWPQSSRQTYIIVGWSSNEGSTWASVSAKLAGAVFSGGKWGGGLLLPGGYLGATTIQSGTSGTSTGAGALSLFGSTSSATGSPISTTTDLFLVDIVPEPTSFALMGLGAAAMLIFRRRK